MKKKIPVACSKCLLYYVFRYYAGPRNEKSQPENRPARYEKTQKTCYAVAVAAIVATSERCYAIAVAAVALDILIVTPFKPVSLSTSC
jgi:hypothetical protein